MILEGCQGKSGNLEVIERQCPQCGKTVEIFPTDTEVECENCGCKVYNDTLDCVRWCDHAKECVGEEMYEKLMKKLTACQEPEEPTNYYGF